MIKKHFFHFIFDKKNLYLKNETFSTQYPNYENTPLHAILSNAFNRILKMCQCYGNKVHFLFF